MCIRDRVWTIFILKQVVSWYHLHCRHRYCYRKVVTGDNVRRARGCHVYYAKEGYHLKNVPFEKKQYTSLLFVFIVLCRVRCVQSLELYHDSHVRL